MIQERGPIRRIRRFRPALFSLILELPGIASSAKPGQFIHLRIENLPGVLLRRPFSIAGVDSPLVTLIVKIVGAGTAGLAQFPEGRPCDAIGPLGQSFNSDSVEAAYLVSGGIGVAPLLFLQDELLKKKKEVHFFLGARTHDEFPLEDEILTGRSIIPCTDDGSFGEKGFVTEIFEAYLSQDFHDNTCIYSCGPLPMVKEAARIAERYGLSHQVSLENRMGCGVGVCQGCALKLSEDGDRGGYRLVCSDGPVFDASRIDWSKI